MNNKKIEKIAIIAILIVQTVIYIWCGINKSYIHMDEAYSLGLATYKTTEIQSNQDFYNKWHSKEYYEDYLSVQKDEITKFGQVYENQKNDVHPPLYYLLLRIAMGFSVGKFSKWPGIILNIVIYAFITIFMYFILQKLLKNSDRCKEKSLALSFISSITLASLTSVMYIRMYALSTLNILIMVFLHMKLLEDKNNKNIKLLFYIGIATLAGILTHYYYLFYLAIICIIFAFIYIKEKNYKQLINYVVTMGISGLVSLIIFPYSIKHMFFGYRGQGAISNLSNISIFICRIDEYIHKVNYYGFNNLLNIIVDLIIIALIVYLVKRNKQKKGCRNEFLKLIEWPTIVYFILVSISSPWIELRYIMPVCGLIFCLLIYYLYILIEKILNQRISTIIVGLLLILSLVTPFIYKTEPEVLYSDKKDIVQKLEKIDVPAIYFFNSQNNRFLDDILLFSKISSSYIAKDTDYTEENINKIIENHDISNGIVIFINEGQDNEAIIEVMKSCAQFTKCEHLKRLNACDVYFIN